ncbi:MAG: universal stress protein [Gemmataceae bacterium]
MKRFKSIVVLAALDDRDKTTLRHVAYFARAAEAENVYLVHIAESFDLPLSEESGQTESKPVDEELMERMRAEAAEFLSSFSSSTQVDYVVREGNFLGELVRLTSQKRADLLCLGRLSHNKSDFLNKELLRLVRRSPCSTYIIPSGAEARYQRILVPVDMSEEAKAPIETARAIAEHTPGAALTLLHVYHVPQGWHKLGHSYEEIALNMKHLAEQQWAELSATLGLGNVPHTLRLELDDDVNAAILRVADEIQADLLVVGSHGRTKPAQYLLGSVASSVIENSQRPVLCVKEKGQVVNLLHALLQLYGWE